MRAGQLAKVDKGELSTAIQSQFQFKFFPNYYGSLSTGHGICTYGISGPKGVVLIFMQALYLQ